MEVSELATRSLDHADILAAGVVWGPSALPRVSLHSRNFESTQMSPVSATLLQRGTYVGKSRGRHCDGIPEDSDGGVTAMRVSGLWYAIASRIRAIYRT